MDTTVIEEIVDKVNQLDTVDRAELLQRLNRLQPKNGVREKLHSNVTKRPPSPNLVWIKKNSKDYQGKYVALKDGELIAYGRTFKEADQGAKAKGIKDSFLHYVMAEGEVAFWAGWD